MRCRAFSFLLALAGASAALAPPRAGAADPYVGYVYPAALAVGSTNRLVVGGQFFWKKMSAHVSGEGVEVLDVESVPSFPYPGGLQRKYLKKALEAVERGEAVPPLPEIPASEEWRSNRWWQAIGTLDAKSRAIVARDLWVAKNALQAAPSLRQLLLVTVAVATNAAPGARQLRIFRTDAVSAPRPIDILPMEAVEEPLYAPPERKRPAPRVLDRLPVAVVGQILPGETDRWHLHLAEGARLTAVVRGRAYQPYIGDAVPGFFNPVLTLRTAKGREVAFADDFNGMDPDPRLSVVVPKAGDYVLEIADRLFRGRADFVYTVTLTGEAPPPQAPATELPLVESIDVQEPGEWTFSVRARQLGSPMDPHLTLLDAEGRELARWDDVTNEVNVGAIVQTELDPTVRFRFARPGRYVLRVDDRCGRRGAPMRCELEAHPSRPSFRAVADRSGFFLKPGQRQPFRVSVCRTGGFAGPVTIVESDCLRFENAIVPAGTNEWQVTAIGKKVPASVKCRDFDILAVGEDGAGVIGAKLLAADPFEQAFAYRHFVSFGRFQFFPRRDEKPRAANNPSERKRK